MARFKEYDQYDGLGLADLVGRKEISPEELCEEAICRAEQANPELNAITGTLYEEAKETLRRPLPDEVFCGVPFLLKDAHHAYKGTVMSQGSECLKRSVSDYDAEIVVRFKAAGLVILGKTNTPEFKLSYVTEPRAFGPCRNPWNTDYSSGGSSGGSAAAVAACIVPMASGTDEVGSIRVPASYCGLFGLKPSRGRNPVGPNFHDEWDGLSTSHVITRSVCDNAAMLDHLSGMEPGAPYCAPGSEQSFSEGLARPPAKLKIAYTLRPFFGREIHPECRKAVEETVALLDKLGHAVEEAAPDWNEKEIALAHVMIMAGHVATKLNEISRSTGRLVSRKTVELQTLALATLGRAMKVMDFIEATHHMREAGLALGRFHETYDMLLTPTLGTPPVRVGSQQPGVKDRFAMRFLLTPLGEALAGRPELRRQVFGDLIDEVVGTLMPMTMSANVTGSPAMSLPLYWTTDGLPCGVQFVGRYGDDAGLLRLAAQLEREKPWFNRTPPASSV